MVAAVGRIKPTTRDHASTDARASWTRRAL